MTRTDTVSGGPRVIDVDTSSGSIDLNIAGVNVANSTNSLGAGIAATNTGPGNVSITSGTVVTSGTGQTYALDARATSGNILINSSSVNVAGMNGPLATTDSLAINAVSNSGNVTVNSGLAISNTTRAISARGNGVDLTSGTVSTAGSAYYSFNPAAAIFVTAGTGGARVSASDTTVSGEGMTGLLVNSAGATRVESGTVTASGIYARGIVTYGAGDAVIKSGTITSTGAYGGTAIDADARLGGSVDIDSATITSDLGTGIRVDAAGGATKIASSLVTTTGSNAVAISASSGTGAISIASDRISTFGEYSSGIVVGGGSGQAGATSITSNDLHMRGGGAAGISVDTAGSIKVASKLLQTDGGEATGISAFSQASDVTVTSDTLTATGPGSAGISVGSRGGNISIVAGNTSITSNELDFNGQPHAIFAQSQGNGSISIRSDTASTVGDNGYAILAYGGGPIAITSTAASTQGARAFGIAASSYVSDVAINAATTTTNGVDATAVSGDAGGNVTIVSGTATAAQGTAIFANAGLVASVSATTASAGGDGNFGISVRGGTGAVLNVGAASSRGDTFENEAGGVSRADAVFAQADSGAIKAVVGSASASGVDADAIRLVANGASDAVPGSTAGSVALDLTGSVASARGNGVFAQSAGNVAITIGAGARVTGSVAGIDVGGSSNSIVNRGIVAAVAGPAIVASGQTNIDNFGTIDGDVSLGGDADRFTTLTSATLTGRIDGGAGADALVLDNTGSTAAAGNFDLARFANFETLSVTGTGSTALAGALPFPTVRLIGSELDVAAANSLATTGPTTITGSGQAETVVNRGTVAGTIDLGAGNDRVENRGTIGGGVILGAGDDTYALYAGSRVAGGVSGGDGTDTIELHSVASDSSPTRFDAAGYTGFERLRQQEGVTALSGSIGVDQVQVVGGRLIGMAGTTITAPTILVGQEGTFGSAGTINGNILVAGTLSPGASSGTMTVNGNVTLAGGSTSLFELTPTGSDKLAVNGNVSIGTGSTLQLVAVGDLRPGTSYTLVTASGGITGSYTTVQKSAGLFGFVVQRANEIDLLGAFLDPGNVAPQISRSIAYTNRTLETQGPTSTLFAALPALLTETGASNIQAFARLTPEPYASATQLGVDNALVLVDAARGPSFAALGDRPRAFTFATTLGQWHRLGDDPAAGTSAARTQGYGFLGGIGFGDAAWSVGAFGGYLNNRQRIDALAARTRAEGAVAGVQGRLRTAGGFGLNASVIYSGGHATTRRLLPVGSATGRYDLHSWIGDLRASYEIGLRGEWALKPQLGLTYLRTTRDGVREAGGSPFALTVVRDRHVAGFGDGTVSFGRGETSAAAFRPFVSFGVRYQIEGRRVDALAGFAGGGLDLEALGASRTRLVGTAAAGIGYRLPNGIDLFASAASQTGRDDHQESISAGVRVGF